MRRAASNKMILIKIFTRSILQYIFFFYYYLPLHFEMCAETAGGRALGINEFSIVSLLLLYSTCCRLYFIYFLYRGRKKRMCGTNIKTWSLILFRFVLNRKINKTCICMSTRIAIIRWCICAKTKNVHLFDAWIWIFRLWAQWRRRCGPCV